MAILVDYRCTGCGRRHEHFVQNPAPEQLACPGCGSAARRLFSPVGMISQRGDARAPGPRPGAPAETMASLCAQNPDVPGLCHMSPSAGRAWVARARSDHRALDAELARQQSAAEITPPTIADAISHVHSPHF